MRRILRAVQTISLHVRRVSGHLSARAQNVVPRSASFHTNIAETMTKLLEHAVAEAARLSESQQDAVATRLLEDLRAERKWERAFAETTDADLDNLVAFARSQAADATPAEDLLRE